MTDSMSEPQIETFTRHRLITEYAPGEFSVRATGTRADVLAQRAEDRANPAMAGKRQAIEAVTTIVVTGPAQWLDEPDDDRDVIADDAELSRIESSACDG